MLGFLAVAVGGAWCAPQPSHWEGGMLLLHGLLGPLPQKVWCGMVWCGVALCGVLVVWCGVVCCAVLWCAVHGVPWCAVVWCVGSAVWCVMVWSGLEGTGRRCIAVGGSGITLKSITPCQAQCRVVLKALDCTTREACCATA